jgi:hypothetical protein
MKYTIAILSAALIATFNLPAVAADAKAEAKGAKPTSPTKDPRQSTISGQAVARAIKSLGLTADEHKDKHGDPHFVLKNATTGAQAVAIYMDDCKAGRCEDVTFYADFGPVAKLKSDTLNEWNHIASKLRSKAFRSGGVDNATGKVGLSSVVSYVNDQDYTKLAMQLGLFLVEAKMMGETIKNLK